MKGGAIRRQLLWKLTRPWKSLRRFPQPLGSRYAAPTVFHNTYCHELKNSNEKLSTENGATPVRASVASQHQRLYRIDRDRDYGVLTDLVARADRTIDTEAIQEQWKRMGEFYSSLASGHTTASVALKRLVACPAKNRFYRAKPGSGQGLQDGVSAERPLRTTTPGPHPARDG